LHLEGENVKAFIPKEKSVSVTEKLKNLNLNIELTHDVENSDLLLVDVS
jgi:hypothetical protein